MHDDAIAVAVARLIRAFPRAKRPPAPHIFVPMMIAEVTAADPSPAQLEAAWRALTRADRIYLPSIAEVLEALREVKP
jgi:hypothetical protein